jgi:hypothetical protein
MLKSLWRRFSPSNPPVSFSAAEERALARYFVDEGLHADLERLHARNSSAHANLERTIYAARSYFAA